MASWHPTKKNPKTKNKYIAQANRLKRVLKTFSYNYIYLYSISISLLSSMVMARHVHHHGQRPQTHSHTHTHRGIISKQTSILCFCIAVSFYFYFFVVGGFTVWYLYEMPPWTVFATDRADCNEYYVCCLYVFLCHTYSRYSATKIPHLCVLYAVSNRHTNQILLSNILHRIDFVLLFI